MTLSQVPPRPELLPAPRPVRRTGDDSPARGLGVYVWRMSGPHQIGACLLAVLVATLTVAPIELQRRLIDDAIAPGNLEMLLWCGGFYLAAILALRVAKAALGVYQGWLGESAIRYTREHLMGLYCQRIHENADRKPGQAVSIVNQEADRLGGFVGEGPSRAADNLATLLGVLSYMAVVEPRIAGFALLVLLPQVAIVPALQRRLNRLTEERLDRLRDLGEAVAREKACQDRPTLERLDGIYTNRMRTHVWKAVLKGVLNLIAAAGPLFVLGFGGWLAIQGETTVGVLVAFLSGFQRLAEPMRELIAVYRQTAQARVQHDMIARWM